MSTICLNMIVKNEAEIIEETLINLWSYINFDTYIIADTGSTDNTKQIIKNFFDSKNIKGEILDHTWSDFGTNRTLALNGAYNKSDYLLIFDADDKIIDGIEADDKIVVDIDANKIIIDTNNKDTNKIKKFINTLTKQTVFDKNFDSYSFKFGPNVIYYRPLLINNRKKWKFVGVLHEYLVCIDKISIPSLELTNGNYHILSGRSGNRSKNSNKYLDDANILAKAFNIETDNGLKNRYAFYCAQSYKDCSQYDKSIDWYLKCLDLDNWNQEKYISCITIGNLFLQVNDSYITNLKTKTNSDTTNLDTQISTTITETTKTNSDNTITNTTITDIKKEKAVEYLIKSIEYDSERIEGIVSAMEILRSQSKHDAVNKLYHKYKAYKQITTQNKLFIATNPYKYEIEYNNSISACYTDDKISGYICCKKILIHGTEMLMQNTKILQTVSNLFYYKDLLNQDNYLLELFYKFNNILNYAESNMHIKSNKHFIDKNINEIWNILFIKNKNILTNYSNVTNFLENFNVPNINKKNIFISFTTCKRFDLFQQTINSMFNHWEDISMIDYWFCVDDNSSQEDKNNMKEKYPWINYYFKTEDEKGHRISMNIIYNKLVELKPKYWIHMEDDFLFYKKMNYIKTAINALNLQSCIKENVKQILFNKNYAEVFADFIIKGGILLDSDSKSKNTEILLHDHNLSTINYSCSYWPYYSFRPSLIDVSAILSLGNYDSNNQFFEKDYANKWNTFGYKSAFFNLITNQHIGRLTSEKGKIKNAYELNNEVQFNNSSINNLNNSSINNLNNSSINKINKMEFKIVNLDYRTDRKEKTIQILENAGIKDYKFITAIDGKKLKPSLKLKKLFANNDFGNRKGVIGCALSHYNLWKELIHDSSTNYYIIMEDDFILCDNFLEKVNKLKEEFNNKELLFLGYHMYENDKIISDKLSNTLSEFIINKLNIKKFIGGTFAYSLNKKGAQILIDYIDGFGICHGIDYVMKIIPNLPTYEIFPQLVFSQWNENGNQVDSNIQFDYSSLNLNSVNDSVINSTTETKIIGFYKNQLCDQDTTTALYDYAYYNEKILGNKSIIFYDGNNTINNTTNNQEVINKFKNRFQLYNVNFHNMDIQSIIEYENISILYFIKYGNYDNKIVYNCKTVMHCVFDGSQQHGDIYAAISPWISNCENLSYVPHMINLNNTNLEITNLEITNLRNQLNIAENAIVFGNYSGNNFDIPYIKEVILKIVISNQNIYFIFANVIKFTDDPNILFLNAIINIDEKIKFINTCDAMIHARLAGETFGLAIGEFSSMGKPIITTYGTHNAHINILGDKAIIYNNAEELTNIFINFDQIRKRHINWTGYIDYTPDKVMKIFDKVFIKEEDNLYLPLLDKFIFIPQLDHNGDDLYYNKQSLSKLFDIADKDKNCKGFNTLGFFKSKIDLNNLQKSVYFKVTDGLYVKTINFKISQTIEINKKLDENIQVDENLQTNIINLFQKINSDEIFQNKKLELISKFTFYPNLDHGDHDLYFMNKSLDDLLQIADSDPECVAVNSLGFFKHSIDVNKLSSSKYFKNGDGLYVKKYIKIKLFCNWCSSEQLCKDWLHMCDNPINKSWKNLQITSTSNNAEIDYYIIINKFTGSFEEWDISKADQTIIFQMEPWVYNKDSNWGIKTWGEWAIPDDSKFLSVRGRKTENKHNNVVWKLELPLNEISKKVKKTKNYISSICSSKYFDEGHIARIDFLKYVEMQNEVNKFLQKSLERRQKCTEHKMNSIIIDIYNSDNNHGFKNYKGSVSPHIDKSKGMIEYKYYFMIENNYEKDFITEKLWEPILCESLCFYYGCPNVSDYINPLAYIELDINDFEKSYNIIKSAIENDLWSQRIDIIREEKKKILDKLAFFPVISNLLSKNLLEKALPKNILSKQKKLLILTDINTTYFHRGRFGNQFLVSMALHFISKTNNTYCEYLEYDNLTKLGIELFIGEKKHNTTIQLLDNNFYNLLHIPINCNVSIINNMWCQTKDFALYLYTYFNQEEQKNKIINANKYYTQQSNVVNTMVFIHIRLGDISNSNWIHPIEYYENAILKILEKNNKLKIYISSDSIEHEICQKLIKKYNIEVFNSDIVDTIMFASTCKYIILSSGTFSWMIGLLSYFSEIYYPKIKNIWHGDIFVFNTWKEIDY